MELSKPNPADTSQTSVLCKFSNLSAQPLENLVFQAAVPKYLKLEMLPPSSTTIPPNSQGAVTQEIKLANSMQGQKNIMLKLKIGYRQGGAQVCHHSWHSTALHCTARYLNRGFINSFEYFMPQLHLILH